MREVTMVRIIGQRSRCHTMLVHLLLIASMVQGITPDQHSLASLRALHILFSSLDFSDSLEDEADSPEEAGLLTESENGLVSRLLGWCTKDPAGLIVQGIGFDFLRFRCAHGNHLNPDRLSILLCRLTC
jgi:hypothetical protein